MVTLVTAKTTKTKLSKTRITMPSTKTATHPRHPEWSITFTESDHSYIDSDCSRYASGSGFVSAFFPAFQTDYHAARIAARENRTPEEVKAEWKSKADESCDYGTHVHTYPEAIIMGYQLPKPRNDKERYAFRAVDRALVAIRQHYDILGCESIIFAVCCHLAGTIDITLRDKRTGMLTLGDFKTNQAIDMQPRFPGNALAPISHIPDCNGSKYNLQLSVYAHIMRIGEYVGLDQPFKHGLIYIPPMSSEPAFIPMRDLRNEADAMVRCWEQGYFGQELEADEYLAKCRRRRSG